MIKTIVGIDGMMCSHCEAHVNDIIRNKFKVKKVTSSYSQNKTEIVSEEPIDENTLKDAIKELGYTVTSMKTEEYKKKFSFFK